MKNKIVVWGTNAENEKVLIALELKADDNKVLLHTFPESVGTEEFVNKLMSEWRNGGDVPFPDEHTTQERQLSVTESLLPEDLKVERGDLIQRAQTEWHFAVLSSKLHKAYEQELAEFKEKIEALSDYDHQVWDGLRGFWDKVQGQARERNLFRHHADQLRDNINSLFDEMKVLRAKVQDEFLATSQKVFEEFNEHLEEIEGRIAAGGSKLNAVFEDLKKLQRRYRDSKMGNEHRNKLWARLDGAFKKAKEKKFGPAANQGSLAERHQHRLGGLNDAIRRMEGSIKRDDEELNFQKKKVATTEGQLEAQIRTAKIKMIEERVSSKREKLAEMLQTRTDVERQIANAKAKEAKRAEKEAERKKIEAAKKAVKEEIAAKIASVAEADEKPDSDAKKKPDEAADTPATPEKEEENALKVAGKVLSESLEDMMDSVKAVGKVFGEKAGEILEDAIDKADDLLGDAIEKAEEMAASLKEDKAEAAEEKPAAKAKPVAEKKAAPKAETAEVPAKEAPAAVEEKPAKAKPAAKKKAAPKAKAAKAATKEAPAAPKKKAPAKKAATTKPKASQKADAEAGDNTNADKK